MLSVLPLSTWNTVISPRPEASNGKTRSFAFTFGANGSITQMSVKATDWLLFTSVTETVMVFSPRLEALKSKSENTMVWMPQLSLMYSITAEVSKLPWPEAFSATVSVNNAIHGDRESLTLIIKSTAVILPASSAPLTALRCAPTSPQVKTCGVKLKVASQLSLKA